MTLERLTKRLQRSLGNVAEMPGGYARLGYGAGSSTIVSDATKRLLWVYVEGQPPFQVKLGQNMNLQSMNTGNLAGVRVRLGYPPYAPNELHILSFDQGEGLTAVGGALPQEQALNKALYPDIGSILNFRIAPNNPADYLVFINGSPYRNSTGGFNFLGNSNVDLEATVTAITDGYHIMAVICLDADTGELVIVQSDEQAGGAGDKQAFDMTTIAGLTFEPVYIPIGAVHLYSGQTAIIEEDIYRTSDPRTIYVPVSSTSSYWPIEVSTALTMPDNRQLVTGGFTVIDGGSVTIEGRITVV